MRRFWEFIEELLKSRWRIGTDESLALRAVVVGSLAGSHAVRYEAAATASS